MSSEELSGFSAEMGWRLAPNQSETGWCELALEFRPPTLDSEIQKIEIRRYPVPLEVDHQAEYSRYRFLLRAVCAYLNSGGVLDKFEHLLGELAAQPLPSEEIAGDLVDTRIEDGAIQHTFLYGEDDNRMLLTWREDDEVEMRPLEDAEDLP